MYGAISPPFQVVPGALGPLTTPAREVGRPARSVTNAAGRVHCGDAVAPTASVEITNWPAPGCSAGSETFSITSDVQDPRLTRLVLPPYRPQDTPSIGVTPSQPTEFCSAPPSEPCTATAPGLCSVKVNPTTGCELASASSGTSGLKTSMLTSTGRSVSYDTRACG